MTSQLQDLIKSTDLAIALPADSPNPKEVVVATRKRYRPPAITYSRVDPLDISHPTHMSEGTLAVLVGLFITVVTIVSSCISFMIK